MARVLDLIDRISAVLAAIAMAEIVLLSGAMCFEVVSRYGFNQPTLWSNDVSLMLNGTMFLLAAGYALRQNAHVRIDILSARLPVRAQHLINGLLLLVLFIPCIGWLGWTASVKTVDAFMRDERELSSAWGPPVWPLYAGMAAGLIGLTLQSLAQAVRHLAGLTGRAPPLVRVP